MKRLGSHLLAAALAATAGFVAGTALSWPSADPAGGGGTSSGSDAAPTAPRDDDAVAAADAAGRLEDDSTATEEAARGSAGGTPDLVRDAGIAGARAAPHDCADRLIRCQTESARVARELAAREADEHEERGEPIPTPTVVPPRFDRETVRAAIAGALQQARAEGRLEDLDCSEHPCIAFGRLRGDEEDMERVERARALAAYRDDVLTMLFWAQSDESAPHERPRETGLFALAFYETRDRETYGDRIDRRIRVRTVELWNTIRPGW